eukprot:scaffold1130_cov195-Pinguiococcus_pyrenoidosus.AAC.15
MERTDSRAWCKTGFRAWPAEPACFVDMTEGSEANRASTRQQTLSVIGQCAPIFSKAAPGNFRIKQRYSFKI